MFRKLFLLLCIVPASTTIAEDQINVNRPIVAFGVSPWGKLSKQRMSATDRALPSMLTVLTKSKPPIDLNLGAGENKALNELLEQADSETREFLQTKSEASAKKLWETDQKRHELVGKDLSARVSAGEPRREFYLLGPLEYARKLGASDASLDQYAERMERLTIPFRKQMQEVNKQLLVSVFQVCHKDMPKTKLKLFERFCSFDDLIPCGSIHYLGLQDFETHRFVKRMSIENGHMLKLNHEGVLVALAPTERQVFFESLACLKMVGLLETEYRSIVNAYASRFLELESERAAQSTLLHHDRSGEAEAMSQKYNKTIRQIQEELFSAASGTKAEELHAAQFVLLGNRFGYRNAMLSDEGAAYCGSVAESQYQELVRSSPKLRSDLMRACMLLQAQFVEEVFSGGEVSGFFRKGFEWVKYEPLSGPPPIELLYYYASVKN